MKHFKPAPGILTTTLGSLLFFGNLQPAQAVSDEEFRLLQQRFEQLVEQVEDRNHAETATTRIGGYGELHYNNLSNGNGSTRKELDMHRFVLFVNHEFSDRIHFFSELEVEHSVAGGSAGGAVELEQAFIRFRLDDDLHIDTGLFLVPVGIINETHEPGTFYGVERNPVEKHILPTTWWEGGVMLTGTFASGLRYDLALHSGLDVETDPTKSKFANIRSGRQKASQSTANNLALSARLQYTGFNGLLLSATLQRQDDLGQGRSAGIGGATLIETHARYSTGPVTLTGLYARWALDGADVDRQQKATQDGGYLEASWKVRPDTGVFVRHNQWDNGGIGDTRNRQTDFGINYWPHDDIVIKADLQMQNRVAGDFDGFNLGIGYQF